MCLLTRTSKNQLPSSRVQLPTYTLQAHKAMFCSKYNTNSQVPAIQNVLLVSAVSWLHGVFLKFSTVTHVFLLFFWWLSGFHILTNHEKIKPSQNLSFIKVCYGWNVKFSHIHELRVNYDPNWKMSWVHLSPSYPHCRFVLFYSLHRVPSCLTSSRKPAYPSSKLTETQLSLPCSIPT